MIQTDNDPLNRFHELYPEIPEPQIPTAYETFRRYVHLAGEIFQPPMQTDLTDVTSGGSVSTGKVDLKRTFINTG